MSEKKLFTTKEGVDAINAVMSPDFQISKLKSGDRFKAAHIIQTKKDDESCEDEETIVTTIISPEGTSYQTLSNFVDRLINTVNTMKPVEKWAESPVEVEVGWRETNSGKKVLVLKLVNM